MYAILLSMKDFPFQDYVYCAQFNSDVQQPLLVNF